MNNTSSRNECADEHDLSGNRICLSMILPEKSNLSFTIMSSNSIGTVSMDPIMISKPFNSRIRYQIYNFSYVQELVLFKKK